MCNLFNQYRYLAASFLFFYYSAIDDTWVVVPPSSDPPQPKTTIFFTVFLLLINTFARHQLINYEEFFFTFIASVMQANVAKMFVLHRYPITTSPLAPTRAQPLINNRKWNDESFSFFRFHLHFVILFSSR